MSPKPKFNGTRAVHKPFGGAHLAPGQADSFAAKLRVDPGDNIIVGGANICRYLGISSITTMWRWVEHYGLPAIRRPDGLWMTSMTSIDQWIFLAAEVINENRETSRGQNTSAVIAAARAQRAAEDPERFRHKRKVAALRAARGVALMPGRQEPKAPYTSTDRHGFVEAEFGNGRPDPRRRPPEAGMSMSPEADHEAN